MGKVRTVLGDIEAGIIGPALMHEHVLFDIVPPGAAGDRQAPIQAKDRWQVDYLSNAHPANAHQTDPVIATDELRAYAADGGALIVDQSVAGLARDPLGLTQAARDSGVHIVAAAGTYTAPFLSPETLELSVAALTNLFVAEVTEGLDGTGVLAGVIGEIGCSWPLDAIEERALRAAARAQHATGAAISVHPGRHPGACPQILDILSTEGADLTRVILCHMDRTYPDGEGIEQLLLQGANVEWDFFGIEQSHYWMADDVELPTDLGRLRLIQRFAEAGHADQILVSHDICTKTRLRTWGGHGYGHIMRNIPPLMQRLDFDPAFSAKLLRETPLRLLTLHEAPA